MTVHLDPFKYRECLFLKFIRFRCQVLLLINLSLSLWFVGVRELLVSIRDLFSRSATSDYGGMSDALSLNEDPQSPLATRASL